jgi:hypothetical protein
MRTIIGAAFWAIVAVGALGPSVADAMHAAPRPSPAQLVARAAAADSTRRLLALAASYRAASGGERGAARRALRDAALERRERLASLMESDPAGMLALALSEELRRTLPSVARGKVERDAAVDGVLEVLHVDDESAGGRFLYFVHAAGRRMALFTAGELPPDALTGARVRVRGKRIARALAFDGSAPSLQVLALAAPVTLGAQPTAVLLVNFQDNPSQPFTPSTVRSTVFTNTSDYDREVSYQRTWLEGDVLGWYTIALSSTVCDTGTLATQARSAAASAGVDLSTYRRFVYVFPRIAACNWAGLGTVGGNPSHAWINGILNMTIVAHEMGHNLGLYHSHALDCTQSSACATVEYGDVLDVMGRAVSGHFNAFQKERLGWLGASGAPPITTVQSSGTYLLDPYESVGSGAKALKVLKSTDPTTGARTWYYVELRRALGFDASMGTIPNLMNGVVVRTGSETTGNSSFLVDMTPETTALSDPALVVGRTFADAGAGISIRPTSVGTSGAAVAVTVGSTACVRGSIALTPSPTTQLAAAGGQTTLAIAIDNGDSSTCPATSVQLAPSVPAGWTASITPTSTSVAADGSVTAELTVGVPPGVAPGTYPVAVLATPAGGSAVTVQASIAVSAGLSVRVLTDQPSYAPSSYVWVTTFVASGSQAAAGTSAVVTLTRPNAATVTRTVTTDANGAATTSFRLRRATPGTYGVTAVATTGGATAISGTGETTFTVQ